MVFNILNLIANVVAGEINVPEVPSLEEDQLPLKGNELKPMDGHYYYQPNPIFRK